MNIIFCDNRGKLDAIENTDQQSKIVTRFSAGDLLYDRGYLFGDGFFTTGIINKGQWCYKALHIERLVESAMRLGYKNFTADFFGSDEFTNFIKPIDLASIRITVTRQQVNRGYTFSREAGVNVSIITSELSELPTDNCQLIFAKTPVSVNPFFAGLKHLNRLDSVYAASEINEPRQEALLCYGNRVIGGSRSNLFIREKDRWLTPKLTNAGINGITKQRVLKMMESNAIKYLQCNISRDQVINCDSAFMTNSLLGIWIVDTIENTAIPTRFSEKLKSDLQLSRQ